MAEVLEWSVDVVSDHCVLDGDGEGCEVVVGEGWFAEDADEEELGGVSAKSVFGELSGEELVVGGRELCGLAEGVGVEVGELFFVVGGGESCGEGCEIWRQKGCSGEREG